MPGELEKIRVWFRDYKVQPFLRFRGDAADCAAGACLWWRVTPILFATAFLQEQHADMPHQNQHK